MKHHPFTNRPIQWGMGMVILILMSACNSSQPVPVTQVVEVTQIVPVTQIRIVAVTQVVQITHIVEVPLIATVPVEEPAPPAPTEAPPPAIPIPPPAPIEPRGNNDLLVWYDFENDFLTSGVVSDRSGNGFDAQIIGRVNVDDGISGGNAIYFPGDAYILAPVNPAVGRNVVAFSLWFKTDHPEYNYKLASAAWWNGGPGSGWILATHIPEFWSDDTRGLYLPDIVNNDNFFEPEEWIHMAVTYDGNRIKEYTNGRLVNDWQTTGAVIGQGNVMAVGAWPQFGFYFEGCIDEFKIFARSLSRQEIRMIYNQGR